MSWTGTWVIMRHGRSEMNEQGRYAGWIDTPLARAGAEEARDAGRLLGELGIEIHLAASSDLQRAARTLDLTLEAMGQQPRILREAGFRERHYGDVQGLTTAEADARFGEQRMRDCMTDLEAIPPATNQASESLAMAGTRAAEAFGRGIRPELEGARNVLLVAHGGVLRALLIAIGALSPEEGRRIRFATASPAIVTGEGRVRPLVPEPGGGFIGRT